MTKDNGDDKMKKVLVLIVALLLSVSLFGCSSTVSEESNEIVVGVSFFPMKDLLLLVEEDLKEEGFDLKIEEFADYGTPNNLLKDKELDANMIQHDYFLQSFNSANDAN